MIEDIATFVRAGKCARGNAILCFERSTSNTVEKFTSNVLNSAAALVCQGSVGQAPGVPQRLAQVKICERRGPRTGRIRLID